MSRLVVCVGENKVAFVAWPVVWSSVLVPWTIGTRYLGKALAHTPTHTHTHVHTSIAARDKTMVACGWSHVHTKKA